MKAYFIATVVIAVLFTGLPGTSILLGAYAAAYALIG